MAFAFASPLNPGPQHVSCHRGVRALSSLSSLNSATSSNSLVYTQSPLSTSSDFSLRLGFSDGSWVSWLGMQDQLICNGCKRVLQYRRGVAGVCYPGCNTLTSVNPSGPEMSELICSGCLTLLAYSRGATNIRCPHCNRVNSTRSVNQIGHLTCGQCRTTLMYPPGASTVQCPTCRYDNPVRNNGTRGSAAGQGAGGSAWSAPPDARPQTVLVENPKTLDEKGKPVSTNVVVGVPSWKR